MGRVSMHLMESIEPREKQWRRDRKQSPILTAGLAALQITGAYEDGIAHPLNIPSGATWENGITEMREKVEKASSEYAAVFVVYDNGTTAWLPPITGEQGGVYVDLERAAQQAHERSGGSSITRICLLHTHPAADARSRYGDGAMVPPSLADTSRDHESSYGTLVEGTKELGMSRGALFSAALDPRGVWYWRPSTDAELEQQAPEIYRAMQQQESSEKTVETFEAELRSWLQGLPEIDLHALLIHVPEERREMLDAFFGSHEWRGRATDEILFTLIRTDATKFMTDALSPVLAGKDQRVRLAQMAPILQAYSETYRTLQSEKIALHLTRENFSTNSVSSRFDFSDAYSDLQNSFLRGARTIVRFAPYQKIDSEPQCAGPDYAPRPTS